MRRFSFRILGCALALALGAPAVAVLAQDAPQRSIIQVTGSLYRFQNNFHFGVFYVTDDGVIVADPINADTAAWLKGEIASRFGAQVRYVVYSHDHADHISGGEVFADTATFISQTNAWAKIENSGHTTAPTTTFDDNMEIELGGKTVELIFPGPSHSDNLIVMRFPAERALFVVDIAAVKRLPFRAFPDAHFPEMLETLRRIEALDFDIMVAGHGDMGNKQDVADHRGYVEALRDAVGAARAAGQSLDEAKAAIKMEGYEDWGQYGAWLGDNIEGMWRLLEGS